MNPYKNDTPEARVWQIAQENGKGAASWAFDGNTTTETYKAVLKGIQDGDPAIMDRYHTPGLNGEFARGYTDQQLLADAQYVPHDGTDMADTLITQYLDEVCDAFWAEIERMAIHQLS